MITHEWTQVQVGDGSPETCQVSLILISKVIQRLNFPMNSDQVFATAKQVQDFLSLQTGRNVRREFMVGRVIPVPKIGFKLVLLRILVDVNDQAH